MSATAAGTSATTRSAQNYYDSILLGGGWGGVNLALALLSASCSAEQQQQEQEQGHSFVILEQDDCLFSAWKKRRWDAFQFNTPAECNLLHGQQQHQQQDTTKVPFQEQVAAWDQHVAKHLQPNIHYKLQHKVVSVQKYIPTATETDHDHENVPRFVVTVQHPSPLPNKDSGGADDDDDNGNDKCSDHTVQTTFTCRNIVCCLGENAKPFFPKACPRAVNSSTASSSSAAASSLKHLHSSEFKNVHQFLSKEDMLFLSQNDNSNNNSPQQGQCKTDILIVGSGQSGIQIAYDVSNEIQRLGYTRSKVYLCTSAVPGLYRSYRGKDVFWWAQQMKYTTFTNAARLQLPDAQVATNMRYAKKPMVGSQQAISFFSLAREQGVHILGGFQSIMEESSDNGGGGVIYIQSNRRHNVQFSLDAYHRNCQMVKDFVAKQQLPEFHEQLAPETTLTTLPEPEWMVATEQDQDLLESDGPTSLPMDSLAGIVWCTGYRSSVPEIFHGSKSNDDDNNKDNETALGNLSLSRLSIQSDLDPRTGSPAVMTSQAVPEGLYYLGYPWIQTLASDILLGIRTDADTLVPLLLEK